MGGVKSRMPAIVLNCLLGGPTVHQLEGLPGPQKEGGGGGGGQEQRSSD